ncbi:MAG: hypothetical protein U1C33_00360, partial [Candidatus Cloacimonadaceae bacterium]|nr:hypothetical protein [Candidatus Cloacimonadaceae bacterium]
MNHIGQGNVVAFFHHSQIHHGLIIAVVDGQYSVQIHSGEVLSLPYRRFALLSDASIKAEISTLQRFIASVHLLSQSLDPLPIAKAFSNSEGPLAFDDCYQIVCHSRLLDGQPLPESDLPEDDIRRFALYSLLRNHPELFYFKHENIHTRSVDERQKFQAEKEQKAAETIFLEQTQQFLSSVLQDASPEPWTPNEVFSRE